LAGDSAASHDGLHKFWELSRDQFVAATICGEPLVAPEQEADCCGQPIPGFPGSRAQRSALVKGLQGQPPFDGRRYPRLPWGGKVASADDIAYVERWIEEGCPDKLIASVEAGSEPIQPLGRATLTGPPGPAFDVVTDPSGYAYEFGEPKPRMDIDCMSQGQLERFRYAFGELYALNNWPEDARSYNNLALIHQNHCQHGWERFLPWHRVYLYEFEQALQDICPDVTMPYWDFATNRYGPKRSGVDYAGVDPKPIPKAFMAYLSQESLEELAKHVDTSKLKGLVGKPFATQRAFFEGLGKRSESLRLISQNILRNTAIIT
jgi:tyrosinase